MKIGHSTWAHILPSIIIIVIIVTWHTLIWYFFFFGYGAFPLFLPRAWAEEWWNKDSQRLFIINVKWGPTIFNWNSILLALRPSFCASNVCTLAIYRGKFIVSVKIALTLRKVAKLQNSHLSCFIAAKWYIYLDLCIYILIYHIYI